MTLFDSNGSKKYSQEMLFDAYKSIHLTDGYGEYYFSDNEWFYVETGSLVENIDDIMTNIFADIYLIDSFVHNSSDEYGMVGFDLSKGQNMIHIEYYGLKFNTQFDVSIYQDNGKWYCTGQGAVQYAKPVCINDFPNGYSIEGFKQEYIIQNRRQCLIVYN